MKSNQSDYLPFSGSVGIRLVVHGQEEEPFPDAFGYSAAAGFLSSIGMAYIRTERESAPYGDCAFDNSSIKDYYYPGEYSAEGCFRSCIQRNVYAQCQCYDPRYATPTTTAYCTTAKRTVLLYYFPPTFLIPETSPSISCVSLSLFQ